MDWVALAVLAAIWAILLVPSTRKRQPPSPIRSDMPTDQEDFARPGRWILSPKRGSRFVGARQRERDRARERRRRVYVFLLEAAGLTGLIGLFPPLRGMLVVTGIFVGLLAAYTVLVLQYTVSRARRPALPAEPAAVPVSNVIRIPEIQTRPDPALEAQDRRLAKLAR
jgi:hypothetical protein